MENKTEQEISKMEDKVEDKVENEIDTFKIQKANEIKNIKELLTKCRIMRGEDLKLAIVNDLFAYLKNNRLVLDNYSFFQQTVKNKLIEFYKTRPEFRIPMKQHYFDLFNADIEPLL